jgi:hypothetical protein
MNPITPLLLLIISIIPISLIAIKELVKIVYKDINHELKIQEKALFKMMILVNFLIDKKKKKNY